MNENDVIKAMECCSTCSGTECHNCPYKSNNLERYCAFQLAHDALDLIKKKNAEIENLKADKEALINGQMTLQKMVINSVKDFAERLKKNFDTYTDEEEANVLYIRDLIDKLVKEMTEGK